MINVIGLGYIGLPTAIMLANHGFKVIGTDINSNLVETLNKGVTTFKEPGLDDLFKKAIKSGIEFSNNYQPTNKYIVSVPTPYNRITKKVDAKYVITAIKSILKVCKKGSIIVIESTIAPGTIDRLIKPMIKKSGYKIGIDIHLVHAPERIIPGNMIYELLNNNRTIGADKKEIGEVIKNIYSSFCKGQIVVTDIKTAEMSKVVENTYRAVNIAFANELAKICNYEGLDIYELIRICNMHPRVRILQPGPGVGGHCISVDPWFLVGDYPLLSNVIKEAMQVNCSMPKYVLDRISKIAKENNIKSNQRIGLYGLTYKENVDDIRESPTLQLLDAQKKITKTQFKVYDPFVEKDIVKNQYHNFNKFIQDVDFVVIMVKHDHIKKNISKLKNKVIFDTCNISEIKGTYKL